MLGGLMPKKKKIRKVSVIEARKILKAEETSKLIDMDKAVSEAIYKAEEDGILFIDEIDKVAGRSQSGSPDVSREGVQRDILPIVEGCTVNTKYGPVKTDHMLFIAAGAFHVAKVTDLIPELQGRFPVQVNLKPLTEEDFRKILTQPENALIKQYQALLGVDDVKLEFTEDALREMAHIAVEMNDSRENIGARRLHTLIEELLDEVSFSAGGKRPRDRHDRRRVRARAPLRRHAAVRRGQAHHLRENRPCGKRRKTIFSVSRRTTLWEISCRTPRKPPARTADPEQAAMAFLCKWRKRNGGKLSEEKRKWLKRIAQKSDLRKNPKPQRGKRATNRDFGGGIYRYEKI